MRYLLLLVVAVAEVAPPVVVVVPLGMEVVLVGVVRARAFPLMIEALRWCLDVVGVDDRVRGTRVEVGVVAVVVVEGWL